MNIQNDYNVNFGAKRILNVRQTVKNGADQIIDVFELGKEDKNFMAKCLYTLKNAKCGYSVQKRTCSGIFQSFLSKVACDRTKDGLQFNDRNYLIAIKNGETITGLAETSDVLFPTHFLENLTIFQRNDLAEDSLMYGLLKKLTGYLKDRKDSRLFNVPMRLSKRVDGNSLGYSDFKYTLGEIKRRNPQTEFNNVKDPYEYDLEEFLDIKDIETEVMV